MAIQVENLPAEAKQDKVYVLKGKTLQTLLKLARRKWLFNRDDFAVQEDDNKFAVSLTKGRVPFAPYVMGTNRTTTDPDPADDTWDANNPPEGTDGVVYAPTRAVIQSGISQSVVVTIDFGASSNTTTNISSSTYNYYTRRATYDAAGRLVKVWAEELSGTYSEVTFVP